MKLRCLARKTRGVAAILVGVLFALRALAYASPPDPSWISGFWDDADYDDCIILITSTAGVADSSPFVGVEPTRIVIGSVRTDDDQRPPSGASSPHRSRAPPASSVSS